MLRTLLPVLAIAAAFSQPAFAFGPAAMGRDLMHTASIGRAAEDLQVTRSGFVRPNVPQVLGEATQVQGVDRGVSDYSRHLGIVVRFAFRSVLAKTADALNAGQLLGSLR
ncbi:hypothetical protein IE4872_PD02034 (plasmid) [Rhizobium gallicum]|uniref:Uncharacterized protein n=1 Tax=Rhizobium gallicum TaxID=56730 RepID=A0A1L5NXE7_9HYPH|nr:hypothetical protein [Rhizobium gallicum]APO72548.1 hypothetical protein IE4872_PD02034 [Rhizobium gallicum]